MNPLPKKHSPENTMTHNGALARPFFRHSPDIRKNLSIIYAQEFPDH